MKYFILVFTISILIISNSIEAGEEKTAETEEKEGTEK